MPLSTWIALLAVAFVLVIVLQVAPWGRTPRTPETRKAFIAARARLRAARTPVEKAAALCELAEQSTAAGRVRRARSLYLRALKVDPSGTAALDGLCSAMKDPAALPQLERILWRMLDAPSSTPRSTAARACLQRLYAGPLAHSPRADAIRALSQNPPEGTPAV